MTVQNYFVMTEVQRGDAMGYNGSEVAIDPRAVDNPSPGVGINLNDNSAPFSPGAVVPLTGMYVAPKRIVDDPEYLTYAPGMVSFLLGLPWCTLESETIFAPPPVE